MDFGKLDEIELECINFKLQPDSSRTSLLLDDNKPDNTFKVFVGCAKWGRKDWVGKLYPTGTKENNFLEYYAKHFNCIEFNAIFYKLPTYAQVREWKSKVSDGFLFCPKFTDVITHIKRLKNTKAEVDLLLSVLYEFGNNLGPIFLMPHPQMGPKYEEVIRTFLNELPKGIDVFLELRHPDWFKNNAYNHLFDFCQNNSFGTVITDTAGRRDCVHMDLTSKDAFIRFVGNSLHKTDYLRIDQWVERIGNWYKKGINKVYFFMHQHDELHSPELVKYLIDELNRRYSFAIKSPMLFNNEPQNKLF